MVGKLSGLTLNRDGTQNITVTVQADFSESYDELKEKQVEVTIKKASQLRSLSANAFLWHLCSEIAKKSSKYSNDGKVDVYREAIRAKGEFEPLLVKKIAFDKFSSRWANKGEGWFVDKIDDWGPEHSVVHAFYGSSTYDSLSMSHVIDYVVNIANDLSIPTITDKELERMLGRWAKKQGEINEQVNNAS